MDNYIEQLRNHNLKATPQRTAIAHSLDNHGHLSVEQLYELLKQSFSTLSLATIYKNINIMTKNSFVSEVKIPEQKSVYELTKAKHSHFVCRNCNEVHDIAFDLDEIIQNASKKTESTIESAHLVFSGVCHQCKS